MIKKKIKKYTDDNIIYKDIKGIILTNFIKQSNRGNIINFVLIKVNIIKKIKITLGTYLFNIFL